MAGYGYLLTTARTIRRNRTLDQQRALARQGENPATGNWWPWWREWTHMTDPVASILTRFTNGPHGTGARAGRVINARKKASSPVNGRKGARYGHLGARYGSLGPPARARKQGAR
jgi:hypothetical protein